MLTFDSKGQGIADEALDIIKFMETGSNVLLAIGVLVDKGRIIEAYNGTQQPAELQKRAILLTFHV